MTDLKPCPACGDKAYMNRDDASIGRVECDTTSDCDLRGPRNDPDGTKWNALPRRVDTLKTVEHYAESCKRVAEEVTGEPPMSRERFRQEAVLRLWASTVVEVDSWPARSCVDAAERITAAVFGEEVE